MDEPQIYARLVEVFQDVFDEDSINITPELSAKDVEAWDSLTHIRLILTIERAFKIKIYDIRDWQAREWAIWSC